MMHGLTNLKIHENRPVGTEMLHEHR